MAQQNKTATHIFASKIKEAFPNINNDTNSLIDMDQNHSIDALGDVVCFSHLRWDFVYQRPQHLLSRLAKETRVFFFEEPVFRDDPVPRLSVESREDGLSVAVPYLPNSMPASSINALLKGMLKG